MQIEPSVSVAKSHQVHLSEMEDVGLVPRHERRCKSGSDDGQRDMDNMVNLSYVDITSQFECTIWLRIDKLRDCRGFGWDIFKDCGMDEIRDCAGGFGLGSFGNYWCRGLDKNERR